MAADVADRLRELARNLLSLEVNTILKENITAERMPAVGHTLIDIAGEYSRFLCEVGYDLDPYFTRGPVDASAVVSGWRQTRAFDSAALTISVETFDRLRWAAKAAGATAAAAPGGLTAVQTSILDRICNNADTLKEILKRPDAAKAIPLGATRADLLARRNDDANTQADLAVEDLLALRKIWEVGTEEVVAQTVIHLDGDVVTRVRDLSRQPGGDVLLDVHRQSVDVAVSSWRYLLEVLGHIAGTAADALFKR